MALLGFTGSLETPWASMISTETGRSADWPSAYCESLFLSLYDEEIVLRLRTSGSLRTEIEQEDRFLAVAPDGIDNKPIDVQRDAAGRLWLLTFTAIYRVDRIR